MIHATKGIVLRTIKYGESSIITTVYTELFGIQSYIVKGIRQPPKKRQGEVNFFQPGAILAMQVYHNELKQLQFIKEYQWAYLFNTIFFDVIRNAVTQYIIELLQHSLKQPEANIELFYFIEKCLLLIDTGTESEVANIPLYFSINLCIFLGFQLQGNFSAQTPIVDLQEGFYVSAIPNHFNYVDGETAQILSQLIHAKDIHESMTKPVNRIKRRELLMILQQYLSLHISDFGEMRSFAVLQELLS